MSSWRGRLFLGLGRLLYVGPVGSTGLHAHHAFQCLRARNGTVRLRDDRGVEVDVVAAVIPPDALHAIVAPSVDAALLYVEPEGREGRLLLSAIPRGAPIDGWSCAALASVPVSSVADPAAARAGIDAWLAALIGPSARPQPLHPGLRRALRAIDAAADGDVRLDKLATTAGVSASRLSHLFAEEMGLGVRPYILWRRLALAARVMGTGASLTAAAHAAGFADAAHLSRTFRRMFGLAPSDVAGWVEWHLLDAVTP